MKTIQLIILLATLFFATQNTMAQDDFYSSSKKKNEVAKPAIVKDSAIAKVAVRPLLDESEYLSYDEYYEKKYAEDPNFVEEPTDYVESDDQNDANCQKTSNGRISGEIVAEIIYNVAFTFLIIWGSR